MKLDMSFVRDLLLAVEAAPGATINLDQLMAANGYKEEDREKIDFHLEFLANAHLLTALHKTMVSGSHIWLRLKLTWNGYEFLESVRDPEVWQRTKDGASKVGNYGLEFLVELAKAYGKHVAKEKLGIDL